MTATLHLTKFLQELPSCLQERNRASNITPISPPPNGRSRTANGWKVWAWHLGLGLALPIAESFLLLAWIVIPTGYIFYGDTIPIIDPWRTLTTAFSVLNFGSDLGTSAAFLWSPYLALYTLVSIFVGPASASRVLTVAIAALPGCFMYLGSSLLAHYWLKDVVATRIRLLFSFVASQVYLLSFVNQGLWNPFFNPWTFSYAILPLVLAGFWMWVFHARFLGLIILAVSTILSSPNPFWIEEAVLLVGPPFLAYSLKLRKQLRVGALTRRILVGIGSVTVANLFWILPVSIQYYTGTATYSFARIPFTLDGAVAASRGYNLLDVLLYGHSTYELFGTWSQNWSLANVVPALFTYVPLLFLSRLNEQRPMIAGLGTSLLVGLFLAKGANPPLGALFYEIGIRLPLGFGVYFRNGGNIFMEQVLAAAALLIGFAFVELARVTNTASREARRMASSGAFNPVGRPRKRLTHHFASSLSRVPSLVTIILAVSAVALPLAWGSLVDQQVYGPRFVATEIPTSYYSVNSFLNNQSEDFNVVWIPNGCCNVPSWKPHILTNFPGAISSRSVLPKPDPYLAYAHVPNSKVLADWMALLGTRYIIVHSDFIDYPWESLNRSLSVAQSVDLVLRTDISYVYEVRGAWSPQKLYILPQTGEFHDGFPRFHGAQFVEVFPEGSNVGALDFQGGQDFTIAAWVKASDSRTQVIIQDNVYGGTWSGWVLGLWEGRPWFQAGQMDPSLFQGLVANMSVADSAWHFIAGERIGTEWRLLVDGELVASKTNVASTAIKTTQNASIGARVTTYGGDTWFFDGSLANVQLYRKALTAIEVRALYHDGMRVTNDMIETYGPVLWALPFNDTLTSPRDLSGNGFRLVPFGTLNFGETPLPLSVEDPPAGNGEVVSSVRHSATDWMVQIVGRGHFTLILAEPYADGWEASWSGRTATGVPLFGGAVTAFNLTIEGPTRVELRYLYQNTLVVGSLASLLGYPAIVFAVSLRKRRSSIHA